MVYSRSAAALALLALPLAAACSSNSLTGKSQGGIAEAQIRAQLAEWAQSVSAEVQQASGVINAAKPERSVTMATLHWRIRSVTTARMIVAKDDTREALLDAWCYSVQMRQFFSEGEGREMFGEHTSLAVAAGTNLEQNAVDIVKAVFSQKDMATLTPAVDKYCRERPMRGMFARQPFTLANSDQPGGFPLQGLITTPLSYLKPFDETASAVQGFNRVASGIAGIVADMPDVMRWNLELLMHDLEERQTTVELVESVQRTSEAVDEVAKKATTWNEDLESTGARLMEELERGQEPLQKTLVEARATTESAERALGEVNSIVKGLDSTLVAFKDAGVAWQETARAFGIQPAPETPPEPAPADQSAPEGPGPSVVEQLDAVRASAEGLATTATELRAGISEVRGLISSGELEQASNDVGSLARASVDHFALRAAQLLALVGLIGLGLVWLSARMRRRPPAG